MAAEQQEDDGEEEEAGAMETSHPVPRPVKVTSQGEEPAVDLDDYWERRRHLF